MIFVIVFDFIIAQICQQHKPLGDGGSSDNLTVPPRRMVQRY